MRNKLRAVWNITLNIAIVVMVCLAIAFGGVRLIGLRPFTILSGSMEPAYHVGSLIYVRKADPIELSSGDVITFMLDENTVATHRIAEVVPDDSNPDILRFRTKGDANNAADGGLVRAENVLGRPVLTIPKLGYLAHHLQTPPGNFIAISVGVILVLLSLLPQREGTDEVVTKISESTDSETGDRRRSDAKT